MDNLIVSFVHGYNDLDINIPDKEHPALWNIHQDKSDIFRYCFPRNPSDYLFHKDLIAGSLPQESIPDFKKLPRFGFTGLAGQDDYIFAGAWNSVYMIDKKTFALKQIISNKMMNDLHGICACDDELITILTCKDTVVISDFDGNVKQHFSIRTDLSVFVDETLQDVDWRFISKQFRGSAGKWHFNYVQKLGNEIWLTTRSGNCFVIVDLETKKARLRLMNLPTPVLLHDGTHYQDKFYFTSIDGKVIVAEDAMKARRNQQEGDMVENFDLFNMDLVANILRLEETELQREPNWCRGIEITDSSIYVSIDGRYGSDLSFGILKINKDFTAKEAQNLARLKWSQVGEEENIRYVTGFDIHAL